MSEQIVPSRMSTNQDSLTIQTKNSGSPERLRPAQTQVRRFKDQSEKSYNGTPIVKIRHGH
jgi:hypothetical protein